MGSSSSSTGSSSSVLRQRVRVRLPLLGSSAVRSILLSVFFLVSESDSSSSASIPSSCLGSSSVSSGISSVDSSSGSSSSSGSGIQVRERMEPVRGMRWGAGRRFPAVFRVVRKDPSRRFPPIDSLALAIAGSGSGSNGLCSLNSGAALVFR